MIETLITEIMIQTLQHLPSEIQTMTFWLSSLYTTLVIPYSQEVPTQKVCDFI